MDTLRVIKNRRPIDSLYNINSNKEIFLVRCTDNESDNDRNKKRKNDFEDLKPEKLDYRQN